MALTLISTHTVDASCGCIDITSGITSTYDSYEFHFVNIHPASSSSLQFQVNAAGASGFNETITSAFLRAYQHEDGSEAAVGYRTHADQAQGTAYQYLSESAATLDDASVSGVLTLYAPSSTTYVKHFIARANSMAGTPTTVDAFASGYINTTSAIDEISFKMNTGNIDAGTIKMFGVS